MAISTTMAAATSKGVCCQRGRDIAPRGGGASGTTGGARPSASDAASARAMRPSAEAAVSGVGGRLNKSTVRRSSSRRARSSGSDSMRSCSDGVVSPSRSADSKSSIAPSSAPSGTRGTSGSPGSSVMLTGSDVGRWRVGSRRAEQPMPPVPGRFGNEPFPRGCPAPRRSPRSPARRGPEGPQRPGTPERSSAERRPHRFGSRPARLSGPAESARLVPPREVRA